MIREKIDSTQTPETPPELPADFLENDPRFKDLVQVASKDYLRSENSTFLDRQGYSWDETGKLKDAEGNEETTPSFHVGPAGWGKVQEMARNEFSERYRAESDGYAQKEKTRIYDSPSSDPAYQEIEREIAKKSNLDRQREPQMWQHATRDDLDRIAIRNESLTNTAFWGKFASEYPEKAAAYATKNEFIAKELAAKEKREQDFKRRAEEGARKQQQNDEARIQEVRESLNRESSPEKKEPVSDPDVFVAQEVPTASPVTSENQPEEIPTPEKNQEHLSEEDIITEYLAYQDIPVSADERNSMLEWSLKSESAQKYAEALQEVVEHHSKEQIEGIAVYMVSEARKIMGKFNLPGSSFLGSKTWAMWDIGKQYYYVTHPEMANEKYTIADPLKSPEKVREIVDRHVGWEAYRTKDKSFVEKFKKHILYSKLLEYLNKPPKKNGDLSSKDLAELGALMRKIAEGGV